MLGNTRKFYFVLALFCALPAIRAAADARGPVAVECLERLKCLAERGCTVRLFPTQTSVAALRQLENRLKHLAETDADRHLQSLDLLFAAILGDGGLVRDPFKTHDDIASALRKIGIPIEDPGAIALLSAMGPSLARIARIAKGPTGTKMRASTLARKLSETVTVAAELAKSLGRIEAFEPADRDAEPKTLATTITGDFSGADDSVQKKVTLRIADLLKISDDGSRVSLFYPGDRQAELSSTESIAGSGMILNVSFHGAKGNWGVVRGKDDAVLLDTGTLVDALEHVPRYRDARTKAIFLNACKSGLSGGKPGREPLAEVVAKRSGKIVIGVNGVLETVKKGNEVYTYVAPEKGGEILPLSRALTMFFPDGRKVAIDRPDLLFPSTQFLGKDSSEDALERMRLLRDGKFTVTVD